MRDESRHPLSVVADALSVVPTGGYGYKPARHLQASGKPSSSRLKDGQVLSRKQNECISLHLPCNKPPHRLAASDHKHEWFLGDAARLLGSSSLTRLAGTGGTMMASLLSLAVGWKADG